MLVSTERGMPIFRTDGNTPTFDILLNHAALSRGHKTAGACKKLVGIFSCVFPLAEVLLEKSIKV